MKPNAPLNALKETLRFLRSTTNTFITLIGAAIIVLFEAYLLCNAPFLKDSTERTEKFFRPSDKNSSIKKEIPNTANAKDNFTAEVIANNMPNSYSVRLTWSGSQNSSGWLIRRRDMKTDPTTVATLKGEAREFVDQKVEANHLYRYALRSLPTHKEKEVQETMVVIPKDLVLNGEHHLTAISKVNRLYLMPGSKIITDGRPFSMNVQEIHSEGGIIETFLENQTAIGGSDGRAAESISISANTGSGRLFVYSRGENGGKGFSGKPGQEGSVGDDGTDAEVGISDSVLGALSDLSPLPKNAVRSEAKAKDLLFCKNSASDGATGGQGTPGGVGGTGGKGGDSAHVFVDIADNSKIQVDLFHLPGRGGAGGLGGPGGPGGLGGKPGNPDPLELCTSGEPGERGADGPRGETGMTGEDGKEPPPIVISRILLPQ